MKLIDFILSLSLIGFMASCATLEAEHPMSIQYNNITKKYKEEGNFLKPTISGIVRIEDPTKGFYCSGFVIDGAYVMTAAHCLYNEDYFIRKEPFNVVGYPLSEDGTSVDYSKRITRVGTPRAIEIRRDFGILEGDFRDFEHFDLDIKGDLLVQAQLRNMGQNKGAVFLTCGYPGGQKEEICYPFFPMTNFDSSEQGPGFLYPGMSGGPVFGKIGDESPILIVGINSAGTEYGTVITATMPGILASLGIEP